MAKLAEYTVADKEKLLKQLLINTTITFLSIVATLVVIVLNIRETTNIVMCLVCIGCILTGSNIFKIMQKKGNVNKYKVAPILVALLLINSIIAVIQRKNEKQS